MPVVISPYLQELPMDLIRETIPTYKSPTDFSNSILLCDILTQKAYIINSQLLFNTAFFFKAFWENKNNINKGIYVLEREAYLLNNYVGLEIEINTHCNFKCTFCPASYMSQKKVLMTSKTYEMILQRAKEYGIKEISLNHYSEPTLVSDLADKICLASSKNLHVTLFTNASNLTMGLVDQISKIDNLKIVINFPESNYNDYYKTTGRDMFSHVVANINYALSNLLVTIWVNNPNLKTVFEIKKLFPLADVNHWKTDDRAGKINIPQYAHPLNHSGLLNGCPLSIRYLNVGVEGEVFLCAQDIEKKYLLGNLCQNSIKEIVGNKENQKIRRWIFGAESAPDNFICRHCRWTRTKTKDFSIGADIDNSDLEIYKKFIKYGNITFIYLKNGQVQITQL